MMSKPKYAGRAKHLAAAGLLALLAACGGGTQVEKFVPSRILVFGDENSVIDTSGGYTANGRKYTVNGFGSDGVTLDCRVNLIWIQHVANVWGRVFPQCNPTGVATTSQIYAVAGAKVGDIAGQIGGAGLGPKDLATVFVGANDLIALYVASPTAANLGAAQTLAIQLAAQIASIVKAGAKVAFLTVPDLGLTPYALQENAAHPGENRSGVLTALTAKFNAQLRTAISNADSPSFIDGHQGVQILADELFQAVVTSATASPNTLTYLNVTTPFCTTASALDCKPNTVLDAGTIPALASGGTAYNYLWADPTHLSPGGHATLGGSAASRIVSNPL
jgi:phospholipase/lecithinase/hemolysin